MYYFKDDLPWGRGDEETTRASQKTLFLSFPLFLYPSFSFFPLSFLVHSFYSFNQSTNIIELPYTVKHTYSFFSNMGQTFQ